MGRRKLEQLVWVAEEGFHNDYAGSEPGYYTRQDGTQVEPFPVGEPIAGFLYGFQDPYDLIREKAKERGLWDNAVNAYTLSVFSNSFTGGKKAVSAQLYWIEPIPPKQ